MRYIFLDNLKGLAIILVVAVHFNLSLPLNDVWTRICTEGASMPQLFFIISAFLTWKSFEKSPVENIKQYCNYLQRKWIRLSPTYYVAIVFSIIISLCFSRPLKEAVDYLMHITYTNGFVPRYTNDILGVEWYISVLAIFYFLAPLLKRVVVDTRSCLIGLVVTMFLSGTTTLLTSVLFPNLDEVTHTYVIATSWIAEFPSLMMGILLYYLIYMKNDKKDKGQLLKVITILLCLIFVSKLLASWNFQIIVGWRLIVYFIVLLLIFKFCSNMPKLPILYQFGKHSYGIYCFHMLLILISKDWIEQVDVSFSFWILIFAAIIIISYVITIVVDRLTNRFIRI